MNNHLFYGTITKINPKGRIVMPIISVILPEISDSSKLARFCTSLFSCSLDVELLICACGDSAVPAELSDKIRVISAEDELAALKSALNNALGKFIVISDVSVTFAGNSLEKLIVASNGNSSACNVGTVSMAECSKSFADGFDFDELSSKPYYFCHMLSADIIKANSVFPCGTDRLSLMLFIADYYRYDICTAVNEVLMYTDAVSEYTTESSFDSIVGYAEVFALTQNDKASLFFLRAVFTALLINIQNESFEVMKAITRLYKGNYAVLAWLKATFGIDTSILLDEHTSISDFRNNGTGVFYREITLPVTVDSVVRNFYFGKFGIDVLKKCIGAWGYYKFYRMKDGPVKKYGCVVFRKLLGGDFDA